MAGAAICDFATFLPSCSSSLPLFCVVVVLAATCDQALLVLRGVRINGIDKTKF
jgi:hypothetical protein